MQGQSIFTFINLLYYFLGKTHIRCGSNGKWMDEFPICRPKYNCRQLSYERLGKDIIIEYEDATVDQNGEVNVPNGKMAKFTCPNTTDYRLQGIPRLLCFNGKWHGLIDQEKPDCVPNIANSLLFSKRVIRIFIIVLCICVFV